MLLRTLHRGMDPTTIPATPERRGRLLHKPAFLSRRAPSRSENNSTPLTVPALPAAFPITTTRSKARRQPCVALLNEVDEDAIVVTALDELPFCCHADLILMPHPALEDVADVLNARLPVALQINKCLGDQHVRSAIELLVGLRKVGTDPCFDPPTNTRLGVEPEPERPDSDILGEPESPLAGRGFVPSTLCAVSEDSHEDIVSLDGEKDEKMVVKRDTISRPLQLRPSKKRKISPSIMAYNWDPPSLENLYERDEPPPRPRSSKRARLDNAFECEGWDEPMEFVSTRPEKPRFLGAGFPSSPMRDARFAPEVPDICQDVRSVRAEDVVGELAMALDALRLPSDVSMASAVTASDSLSF